MISQSRSSPPSSQGNGPGANAPDGQSYLEKVLLIIGLQNRPILTVEEAGRKKEKGKRERKNNNRLGFIIWKLRLIGNQ